MRRYLVYEKKTGRIHTVREGTGINSPAAAVLNAVGEDPNFAAVPYDESEGRFPIGKMINVGTKKLIVDPGGPPTWSQRARAAESQLNAVRAEAAEKGIVLDSL